MDRQRRRVRSVRRGDRPGCACSRNPGASTGALRRSASTSRRRFAPPPRGSCASARGRARKALPLTLCRERIVGYFAQHPAGGTPRIAWLGPRGTAFRLAQLLWHELPELSDRVSFALRGDARGARTAQKLRERRRALHKDFAYFTHATFDFASQPAPAPRPSPRWTPPPTSISSAKA
jgi:hypothetical protein